MLCPMSITQFQLTHVLTQVIIKLAMRKAPKTNAPIYEKFSLLGEQSFVCRQCHLVWSGGNDPVETWETIYKENVTVFQQTGTTTKGWSRLFEYSLVYGVIVPFAVKVMVRLYGGEGYCVALAAVVRQVDATRYVNNKRQS